MDLPYNISHEVSHLQPSELPSRRVAPAAPISWSDCKTAVPVHVFNAAAHYHASASQNDPMASYNGKLLWVNHDADNLKPKVNRYTVFSHVQNEYHRWRRQDAIDRLKASSRIPRSPQNKSVKKRRAPLLKREESTHTTDLLSAAPPVLVSSEDDNEHRLQLAKWHGNSDPFSAFSVPITARVNQLMSFERDVLHPAVHGRWALRATEWDYCCELSYRPIPF